jgi:hypothetical protein
MTPRIALVGTSLARFQARAVDLNAIVLVLPALPLAVGDLRLFDIVVLGDEALCVLDAAPTIDAADDAGAVIWMCQDQSPLGMVLAWLGSGVLVVPPSRLGAALAAAGSGPALLRRTPFDPGSVTGSVSWSHPAA